MRTVAHPDLADVELCHVLHALSDPVRLEIVKCLAGSGEQHCGALECAVSKSTLSHHLKVLREAGLTHTRADGTRRLVVLRRDELEERFPAMLGSVLDCADPPWAALRSL
ncbi:MAG: ArsR/SmtB family transcription factor [Thermoleophilaceae bacterium]|jgi:DNA-binding transcriptional ArsR family regulator